MARRGTIPSSETDTSAASSPSPCRASTACASTCRAFGGRGCRRTAGAMSIARTRDTLFNTFFVYDDTGRGEWIVMPGGTWNADLHGVHGSALHPARVVARQLRPLAAARGRRGGNRRAHLHGRQRGHARLHGARRLGDEEPAQAELRRGADARRALRRAVVGRTLAERLGPVDPPAGQRALQRLVHLRPLGRAGLVRHARRRLHPAACVLRPDLPHARLAVGGARLRPVAPRAGARGNRSRSPSTASRTDT
jgi:hypothetical protein